MTGEPITPQQLVADWEKYKLSQSHGSSMATANWVTALAHKCTAYAIYNRTVPPEKRRAIDNGLAMIFSEGNDQARMVKRDLEDMGYEIEGQEGQMSWPKYQITGRKDFAIRRRGSPRIRVETKSCNPYTWEKLSDVASIRHSRSDWIQKWDKQVCLYMVLQSVEVYWLLLKNKSTGRIKVIEYRMDDEVLSIAERMISKAATVNLHIEMEEPPGETDKIADPDVCCECEMYNACLPSLDFGSGARILTDEMAAELVAKADRWTEIRLIGKEFEDLDAEIKDRIKSLAGEEATDVVFSDWVAHLNRIPTKKGTQVRVTFLKTGKAPEAEALQKTIGESL